MITIFKNKTLNFNIFKSFQYRYYCTTSNNVHNYDVIIVGGGLVGGTLACSLGSSEVTKHLKVALIESSPLTTISDCLKSPIPDIRTISFNNSSVELLKECGVWNSIESTGRLSLFNKVKVWDTSGFEGIQFEDRNNTTTSKNNGEIMGYVIENKLVTSALLDKVNNEFKDQIHIKQSLVSEINRDTTTSKITLKDGQILTGKLIVGADGGNSLVKKVLGVQSAGRNYNQKAVVCTIQLAYTGKPCTTLYQRFLPTGPIAILPLANNYANIIWSTHSAHADYLLSLSDDAFKEVLESSLLKGFTSSNGGSKSLLSHLFNLNPSGLSGNELDVPPIEKIASKRGAFPLRLDHIFEYTNGNVVLVGDAAHVVHPLAGQGVNLGLQDVKELTSIIRDSVLSGYQISDPMMLKKYQENRKLENLKMMVSIDTLYNIFTNNSLPIVLLRNLGMSLLNHLPIIKDLIIGVSKGNTTSKVNNPNKNFI